MAYVDFNFIQSGKFAKLKDPTKAVLHVITGVCNRETGEFYHSVPTLAGLAGVSRSSARAALRELEKLDPPILSSKPRPGKPAVKVHLPTAEFSQHTPAYPAGPPAPPAGVPRHLLPGSPDENSPQTPAESASTDLPFPPNNNSLNNRHLTTTAADRISASLIQAMKNLYGAQIVNLVVVAMRSMNGEVKDANAYFRTCVENHWIPTSKKARENQKRQARQEAARRAQEQAEAERKQKLAQEQERHELAALFDTLSDDQKDHILQTAAENTKSQGITPDMMGFDMCVLSEEYKILRQLRAPQ